VVTQGPTSAALPPGLLLLADARFPAGGHVHSAGLEAAVSIGDVHDPDSLMRYLRDRLHTTGSVDAAFAAATTRSCQRGSGDAAGLRTAVERLDAEYAARTLSPYLRETSRRLGRQLLRVTTTTWPSSTVDSLLIGEQAGDGHVGRDLHQPLAMGVATFAAGGREADAATITIHQLAGAVTSAATRLLGLDPIELAALQAVAVDEAVAAVSDARAWDTGDLARLPATGGALTEILGEHHGSLDARLFAT
jgi:urease accessory protein